MKRLRKRAISIVLMLTMVFTLFPTTAINAYAAEDNTEYSQLMDQQEDETVSESEDGFVSDENEEITDPEESETEDSFEDLFDDDTESVEESLEEDLIDEEIPEEELLEEDSSKLLGLEPEMSLTANAADYETIEITSDVYGATSASTLIDSLDGFCKLSFEEAKSWDPPTKSGWERLIYDYEGEYIRCTIFDNGKYKTVLNSLTLDNLKAADAKYYYIKKTVVAVNSVTLSPATVTLTAGGEAVAMTATVTPDNATEKKVKWSVGGTNASAVKLYSDEACNTEVGSDATETLTVYAKGMSAGSATVTVTSNADSAKSASCDVMVNEAVSDDPYASLLNTTTEVTFDGKQWYLIEDNSTAANAGTVTLLTKECVAASQYNSSVSYVEYASSTVKTAVDNWYNSNITDDAKGAVSGGGMFLLTTDQANAMTADTRKCSAAGNYWWLCSRASYNTGINAACVLGFNGTVQTSGDQVTETHGVRPALKLDLSKVEFDSSTNTFSLPTLDPVSYLDASGNSQTCETYTVVTDSTTDWSGGWYVVNSNVTFKSTVGSYGDVNIILCDNAKLTFNPPSDYEGFVSFGSLTIYAQSTGNGMGELVASSNNSITIATFNGDITINGGKVTATASGSNNLCCAVTADDGNVTINGGIINATGYKLGIDAKGNVEINGGTVTAQATDYCAIECTVKNKIAGVGWTDASGSGEGTTIAVSETGQDLSAYKKVQFTADAGGTTYNPASEYHDYGNLISNNTEVTISEMSGKTWYVIEYDSSNSTVKLKNTLDDSSVLNLNLSYFIFDSESNTFSMIPAGYNVTITVGSNMTKTETSGAESQTGLSGAMENVVYIANDGYKFPETDDAYTTTNGIKVEVSQDQKTITVSGTPTANTEITIPDAVEDTASDDPYAALLNTTTVVKFDGKDWYLIENNSTAVDAGTVTLLSKECVAASKYSSSGSYVEYASSTVKTAVDNYYTNSISSNVKTAIVDNKMFLLTKDQANAITNAEVRKCSLYSGTESNKWWLCSPGSYDFSAACVIGASGNVYDFGLSVGNTFGVRPALKLDLSKVTFDSDTNTFAFGGSVDKTALNNAITAAETLYDSIENNNDYTDIASTLKTEIDNAKAVADSDTADQNAVDAATTAITTAKKNAEAAKKDVDDTTEANKVSTLIENLPAKEAITKDDTIKVEAAKVAFNELTEDQKKKVSDADKQKLNDAVAAIETIEKDEADTAAADKVTKSVNALPASDKVATTDKAAIEAARKAYDALTADQKKKVSPETLKKLTDAEDALAAAEVSDMINAFPSADKVTADDKSAIELARNKYGALNDEQKQLIGRDVLAKLEAVEAALSIAFLPSADKVTKGDKDVVLAVRDAYNKLTDEQRTQVGSAAEDKLKAVEVALLKALIAALPSVSTVKSSDADKVAAAKNLYDNLTDDQKEQITASEKNKLDAVVEALSDAEVYYVRTMINDLPLPAEVTLEKEAEIIAARAAFEQLSDARKAFVGVTSKGKLVADETVLAIIKLPTPVTIDNKETVKAIREAYDSLTDAQKEEISKDKIEKLEAAEAALDIAVANDVKDKINALPASAAVTIDDKDTIEEARAAYNALTEDQKKLITNETLGKLEEAESALAAAEAVDSVTSIKLRAVNGTTMIPGSSQVIEAAIIPSLVSANQLKWSSSNENVATVTDEGKAEVKNNIFWGDVKSFDVTITAESTNGVKGSIKLTVKPEAEKNVTDITIDPKSVKTGLKPGDTFRLTAMTKPADATDKTVVWSSDNEIAQVGPTGIVTITGTGTAKITVTAGTDAKVTDSVDLVIEKKDVTGIAISTTGGDYLVAGRSAKLSAKVTPSDATYQDVFWSSSDPEIADVDDDGTVTAKAAGNVSITATWADPEKKKDEISASKEYVVFENDDSLHVEFVYGSEYYYTGRAITPLVNVYYHGKALLRDTDYTVSYRNNKNANDAFGSKKAPTVKVTGKTVAASAEATFKILPVDIGDEELVTAEELNVAYKKTASPVLFYGGTKLKGSDISNSHAKFKFTESRAITVYGKGNFTGEREIWVNVKSSSEIKSIQKIKVKSFKPAKRYYNGQDQPLNARESAEDNDNEIVVVSASDKSKSPKELVLGEDFYIAYPKDITNAGTVKVAVIGMGDYTGAVSKSYKILAAKDDPASVEGIDIIFRDSEEYTIGGKTYDYYEYRPGGVYPYVEVVATYKGEYEEILDPGKDYKVTFANNKKAGEINENKLATATITFKGNYKSLKKKTKQFFITKADISDAAVNLKNCIVTKANAKYPISVPVMDLNGVTVNKIKHDVTYKVDGKEVNKNTKGAFEAGRPVTVTVEIRTRADSNYTGTATGEYTVTLSDSSKNLSKAKVIIQKKGDTSHKAVKKLKFTGNPIEFPGEENDEYELYVYIGKSAKNPDKVLIQGTDYVATYSNNVKAGKAIVVLNAVEGEEAAYFGSKTFTFKIVKGSMPWFK